MPRITVVVPASEGADRTVRSVSAQRVTDIETLVVTPQDDGSDARDGAVAGATGEYLSFLPSGSVVTAAGYDRLLESLGATGSDVGVGGVQLPAATGVRLSERPDLVAHLAPGAMLWRRSFWLRHGLRWRDRPPYEDTLTSARGLLLATGIDTRPTAVIAVPSAPDRRLGHSLRRDELAQLVQRLDALRQVTPALPAGAIREHWLRLVVEPELRRAVDHIYEADEQLRTHLVAVAAATLADAGPELERDLAALHRLRYHLVRRGLVPELLEVIQSDRLGELTHRRPLRRGRSYFGDYPFRTDRRLDIPRHVYRLDRELRVRARVDDAWWDGATLHVEGIAYLGLLGADAPRSTELRLRLVRTGDERSVPLPVERRRRPDVTVALREPDTSYDWAGFATSLDAGVLRDPDGWTPGVWALDAEVGAGGVRRSRRVVATGPGRARRAQVLEVSPSTRVVASGGTERRRQFAVEVDIVPALVRSARLESAPATSAGATPERAEGHGGALWLDGTAHLPKQTSAQLSLRGTSGAADVVGAPMELLPAGGELRRFDGCVPLAALLDARDDAAATSTWQVQLAVPGRRRRLTLRAPSDGTTWHWQLDGDELAVRSDPRGRLTVECHQALPVVTAARWDEEALRLSGRWPGDPARFSLALLAVDGVREHRLDPAVTGGSFGLRFRPGAVPTLGGTLPLTRGDWLFVVRQMDGSDATQPLLADGAGVEALPLRRRLGHRRVAVTAEDRQLRLDVGPDLDDDERGAHNQRLLQRRDFPRFVVAGLRDEVLFESYQSRAYGDNARAVFEELERRGSGLRCRWVVVDGQTELPADVTPVRQHSRDYYEALARSRFVVISNHRPLHAWLDTPAGQIVVQTWHGAPFKRIGNDNPRGFTVASADYRDRLHRETQRWDWLLSPNPPSTPILRQAFGYHGRMLETGYPRVDIHQSPHRDAVAARVRSRLELPEGKRVVLYAPTMRDDLRYGGDRYLLDLRLDLNLARAELGEDHVLLVRRHGKVVDSFVSASDEFVREVSLWPDVNELLLVTDVLVTDYSSLLFDFAVTGRPMVFYTYDLADYRDRLRGLYFSTDRLPGPTVATTEEVLAAIRSVDSDRPEYADAYAAFRADFCAWDDGNASARFVDAVFADHLSDPV